MARILVVDDNKDFCEGAQEILEMEGHLVTIAHDGDESVIRLKENQPELVLMDLRMPKMNGVRTFDKMREMVPDIPVIIVTAFPDEQVISEALRKGAIACLEKPLDFEQILTIINHVLKWSDKGKNVD